MATRTSSAIGVSSDMMISFKDKQKHIDRIKTERGCLSSVVFDSPDGLWWVPGKYYPEPGGAYIHPVMRLLNEVGGSRPGIAYIINHVCVTCEAILKTFPQFDRVIVRAYNAK